MTSPGLSATLGERLAHHVVRILTGLPPALQVRLSGRPPIRLDGDTLAPEVQLTAAIAQRRAASAPQDPTPSDARRERRRRAAITMGRPAPVAAVRDVTIDAGVPLRGRHYAPDEPGGPHPLLVFFHGGGFVFGDLDTHDDVCRLLCHHAGAHVLAVDYRLAPEHPFPAAVQDARGALRWAQANAAQFGADPGRVGVGGDSAGGNLAAVVAQLAAADGGPAPVLQLLIYPVTDLTSARRRSQELFGEGFILTDAEMDWFATCYLGPERTAAADPRASPLLGSDLAGLAPAIVITAWFDPLRDEAEEYAAALRAAGTPTTLRRFRGLSHAFMATAGVSRVSRDAVIEIAGATRALFAAGAGVAG